ncbi:MAG TPA: hypothetical protein VFT55_09085 [Planctomycetota bacterium]|nr:hypothetical protein [Planctomycetota bacterium]
MHPWLAVLSCSVSAVAQVTWTVNSAGGAQFTAIQPAITAAAPGDRIEVQGAGPYAGFVVDRGVDVESLIGALCGSIEVVGLPAGQAARVSGFVVDHQIQGRVSVRTCAGKVNLANVAMSGTATVLATAQPGLEVLDSQSVLVDHGNFSGQSSAASGAPGAAITNSQVAFVAGSALGGLLVSGSPAFGSAGRAGIQVTNSHTTMTGVTLRGGAGTSGTVNGGNGGDALHVISGVAIVSGFSQLRGGFGGIGPTPGQQGFAARGNVRYTSETFLIGATTGATVVPQRPVIQVPGGVLLGTTLTWSLAGPAGQLVVLALDLDWQYTPLPVFDGGLVLTGNAVLVSALVLDAQGSASHALAIPNTQALRHLNVFAQGLAFVGPALVLTGATATHIL